MAHFLIFYIYHINDIEETDRKLSKTANIMFTTIRFIDDIVMQSETEILGAYQK